MVTFKTLGWLPVDCMWCHWHLVLIAERLGVRQLILLHISFCIGIYVCMSVTLRNANFLCAAVRCKYGACMRPHYCCQLCEYDASIYVSLLQQWWVTGSTENEDDTYVWAIKQQCTLHSRVSMYRVYANRTQDLISARKFAFRDFS